MRNSSYFLNCIIQAYNEPILCQIYKAHELAVQSRGSKRGVVGLFVYNDIVH